MHIDDVLYTWCRCMADCVTATERVMCLKRALCAVSGMSCNASALCAVESVCAVMRVRDVRCAALFVCGQQSCGRERMRGNASA
jgi:hypothetical protein